MIQAWALTQISTWVTAAIEKLGTATWQRGKVALLGDALSRAFQAGLENFLAETPDSADYDILYYAFKQDAVIIEQAAKLLRLGDDPIDLDRIEASLRAAGLEPETLPDFDLGEALRRFFLAFLNAANDQDELRSKFQIALRYSNIQFKHDRAIIARYNQHVLNLYGRFEIYSLKADAPLRVELERVYVQLTTIERVRRARTEIERDEQEERGKDKLRKREIVVERTLSAREALAGASRLVIVGAPGSGKTTLLQWIALTFARDMAQERLGLAERRIPIFVPLRALGKYIDTHPNYFQPTPTCLLDFLEKHFGDWKLDLPSNFFIRMADEGRCAFLFDGLDEVADPGRRSDVSRAVQAFVARYPGNRYTVTSRPAGYTGLARFGADFQRCDVRPFSDNDIREFVASWYLTVETSAEDNPATRQKADENAADLLQCIRENERIRRLVSTPLLLTVVALVHQNRTALPHRRAELYDECTQMLLGFWDEQKSGAAARELARRGGLDRYEKRAILEPVALHLHEQHKAREVEGYDLRNWLEEEFTAVGDPHPTERAKLFLQVIQERSGLLIESASDTYRFSHFTFQEYLAARAVADRDDYVKYVLERRHAPWWREVILLTAGHLSTQYSKRARRLSTELIKAIWTTKDEDPVEQEIDQILHRNLLLVGRCLADLGPIGVEETVRDGIVAQLGETLRSTPYSKLREETAQALAGLRESGSMNQAIKELIDAFVATRAGDDWRVHLSAASSLVQLGSPTLTVVQAVIDALINPDLAIRQTAVSNLDQFGHSDPAIIQALITALTGADEWRVRQAAASSLGQLRHAVPNVVQTLTAALTDADSDVRQAAALSLGQLATVSPDVTDTSVIQALVTALTDDDPDVRQAAASSLGQLAITDLDCTDPTVAQALVAAFSDDFTNIRQTAASSLVKLATIHPGVNDVLTDALTNAGSWRVRQTAASSLLKLAAASSDHSVSDIVSVLTGALTKAGGWRVRQAAASSLSQLATASPDHIAPNVIATLITALTGDAAWQVRQAAAFSLVALGQTNPDVIIALTNTLAHNDDNVRQTAASGLVQLGQTGPDVVAALVAALTCVDSWRVRQAAASSLGQLATTSPECASPTVVAALITTLTNDGSWRVRRAAASSLGQFATVDPDRVDPDVITTLVTALADDDYAVRQAAASSLGQLGCINPKTVGALVEALKDSDNNVRKAAANGLARLTKDDRKAILRALLPVFADPAFEQPDIHENRPAYDYAFDALWAIAGGAASLQEE